MTLFADLAIYIYINRNKSTSNQRRHFVECQRTKTDHMKGARISLGFANIASYHALYLLTSGEIRDRETSRLIPNHGIVN